MSKHSAIFKICLGAAMATVMSAPLAQADPLVSNFAFKIVEMTTEGEELLVDRKVVKPGETIQYSITHENTSEDDLAGIIVTAPIPDGVTLAIGSESSSISAKFEIQAEMEPENPGLEWATLPAFRKVIDENGNESMEPVPADAIAAVRWSLEPPLHSGEVALNSYRVIVN